MGAWREGKRKEQRVRVILGRGEVPTKVAVGRDRNEVGVLLLLAPRLVGPVIQMCQVRRALRTELHPGRACKDSPISIQGGSEVHPLGPDTLLDRHMGSHPHPRNPTSAISLAQASRGPPTITLTECQLSQWQRAETGMAVLRCGLLCWSMQASGQPCVGSSCQHVDKHMAMRWGTGNPVHLRASVMGVEGTTGNAPDQLVVMLGPLPPAMDPISEARGGLGLLSSLPSK